jgi:alkylation response protein AidB-like acyl-CoA dehydrogenase
MLLWGLVLGALGVAVAVAALLVAMRRAEQRTRRSLFRTLGVGEEAIGRLMDHKGDLVSALELVRRPARPIETARREPRRAAVDPEPPERSTGRIRDSG